MDSKRRITNYVLLFAIGGITSAIVFKYMVPIKRIFKNAASRVVLDIEEGAKIAKKDGRYTVEHKPMHSPKGCSQDYTIQVTQNQLQFICKTHGSENVIESYTVTNHMKYAQLSKDFMVRKSKGQTTYIYLEPKGEQIFINDVR